MPFVKPISGHTKLGAAQRYLEKEGRALARDFLNLDAPMEGIDEGGLPEYGDYDWSSVMDSTREKLGNDRPFKGRKARTYKHYVISPDPRDSVSLSQLRSVTMSWVEENFGDYEVAVVYHDDNERHVPHAHVIVNNTNLDTGRRLQDPDPGALNGSLQRIARDTGLTHLALSPGAVSGASPPWTQLPAECVACPTARRPWRGSSARGNTAPSTGSSPRSQRRNPAAGRRAHQARMATIGQARSTTAAAVLPASWRGEKRGRNDEDHRALPGRRHRGVRHQHADD